MDKHISKNQEMYTSNFSVAEMACRCGECDPTEQVMDIWYMKRLQKVRNLIAEPLTINSGFRCLAYNQSLPKASTRSYHLQGRAADISLSELPLGYSVARFRMEIVEYAFKAGLYGIGIGSNFIHLDNRGYGQRRMWVYS